MPSKQEQPAATSKAISLSPLKFRDALKGLLAVDPKAIPPAPAHNAGGFREEEGPGKEEAEGQRRQEETVAAPISAG